MTIEDRLRQALGAQAFEIIVLQHKLEEMQAELEKYKELSPPDDQTMPSTR